MPWCPCPESPPAEPPIRITVDGQEFEVRMQADHPGHYNYTWISGPNPGYGFGSGSSDGLPCSLRDHEDAIRDFLSDVDPNTGNIE